MKKFTYIFIALSLTAVSCVSQLDIQQHGVLDGNNYYKSDSDADAAITAVYGSFEDVLMGLEMSYNMVNSYLSDEFWHGQAAVSTDLESLNGYWFDADHSYIESLFTNLYNVVGKCNVVLDNVKGETDYQKQVLAEARVFRAWMYFELTTLWGNPPLVSTVPSPAEAAAPNADPAELWAFMEEDLTEAIATGKLVSKADKYDRSNYRITQEYAEALLGKVYLWQGKNKEAAEVLQKVIDSNLYDLFRGTYGDMFNGVNQNNEEVVFSSHFVRDLDNPAVRLWPSSTGLSAYSRNGLNEINGEPNECHLFYNAWGGLAPRGKIYDAFVAEEGADGYRLNETIKTYEFMADKGYTLNAASFEVSEGYYFWKGRYVNDDVDYNAVFPTVFRDICWMRYAEVLLMAAEANIGIDQTKADKYLNEVRTRAQLEYKACDLDAVKTERLLELYGENIRFKDLLRWGDAATVLKDSGKEFPKFTLNGLSWESRSTSYGFKEGKHEHLPYPSTEIMANKHIVQNNGWK